MKQVSGILQGKKRSTKGWTREKRQAAKDRMLRYWAEVRASEEQAEVNRLDKRRK